MAEAAVTFLLQQLKEVMIGYKDLITGAENEFMQLRDELELLKAFLMETAEKNNKDHVFRNLLRKIINVMFEVENIIDICLTETMTSRNRFLLLRTKLAKKVKSIRTDKVQPLFADFQQWKALLPVAAKGAGADDPPPPQEKPDIPIRKNKIIGFKEDERKITEYLMEETEKLNVISIIGMPGIGKTALAGKIYQNMHSHFTKRIWIHISEEFNIRDILLQILGTFTILDDNSRPKDDELPEVVRSTLEKEKFLLVLDDLWSVDAWKIIKEVLPENNGVAKVLITSRETIVGLQSRVYTDPQYLGFLDASDSRELLKYEVFGNSVVPNSDIYLTDIMGKIADKCGGVPLTIVLIGGILANQLNTSQSTALSEWKMVAESVSDALQNDQARWHITKVVELSYNSLPDDLRECFVYMGVFPEDYEIPIKMLCELWISEGFILRKNVRLSLEQCAEQNLNNLISRNLIQVEKTNQMGRVKTCRVHDMIRVFCIAKLKEDKFFHEVKTLETGEFIPSLGDLQNSRGLSFSSDPSLFLSQNPVGPIGPHVRSFLCLYDKPVGLEAKHINAIPNGFDKLRILESRFIKFHQFPQKVTKLIHLRYLTLNIDTLTTIPKLIMDLWNLRSLLIETRSHTIVMKANMWKMIRLRYLRTKAAIVLDAEWKGDAGENLHTLNRLSPESCTERVADKAKNLSTLGISGKLTTIFHNNFLEKLHRLEKLKLVNDLPSDEYRLHAFPRERCFPPNLKRLTLTNTFLDWQLMSTLAKIKSLEVLKLKDNAFAGDSWNVGQDNFPNLQLLLIMNITELIRWEATDQAFPKLKFLVVKYCESLEEIPECLGKSLEKLEIEGVQDSVVNFAKKIEEMKEKEGIQFNLTIGSSSGSK